jgi:uncharacterized peroxidase-related enzyme
MPYIDTDNDLPGIIGLLAYRPATGALLNALAEVLLRDESTLSRGEREAIAAYVSGLNDCRFCCGSHSAFAAHQLEGGNALVEAIKADPATAPITQKLRALLRIAAQVQRGGRFVSPEDVHNARLVGATDLEIHDTVLIAAAFCMYNRYVDGLATLAPGDPARYEQAAQRIMTEGYHS